MNWFSCQRSLTSANPLSTFRGQFQQPEEDVLARRFTRFAAAIVDGILMMILLGPIYFFTGFVQRAAAQQVGVVEQIAMTLVSMAVVLVLNGYLLASRGQTIGKFLTKIQIVDYQSGNLQQFLKLYVFRYLWLLPLAIVLILIPGSRDDLLLQLVSFIDILLIFGSERRCLHDLIAGTKVVEYQPNRPYVSSMQEL